MPEDNKDNEERRPSKMRGVAFPKAKYGAIIMFFVLGLIPAISSQKYYTEWVN